MSLIAERKHGSLRKLLFTMIGVLFVAVVYFAVHEFMLDAEPERASIAREKSITVLPFDDLSGDSEFAYGIRDEVLTEISKIRDLKVLVLGGPYGGPPKNRPTRAEIIARLVGVAYILEGSVRLAGNQVRITVQLIEAESDAQLWTETYDRELTAANIFSIQSDVAKTVADAVQATLSPEEQD
jgi:TolB-like protein